MDTKKKVVLISAYSGMVNRGVETVVDELAKRLKNECFLIKIIGGESMDHHAIHIDIKIHDPGMRLSEYLFLSRRKISESFFYIRAIRHLFSLRPDVVMAYNCGWHLLVYKMLSKLLKFSLVLSGQSGPGWDDKINLLLRPDVFVCLSKVQMHWARSISKQQKIVVIPNGVDTKLFYPAGNKKTSRPPVLLTVAASEKAKNIDKVIKAIASENYRYIYVGDGTQAANLDKLGHEALKKNYQRLSVRHEKLPEIYRQADAFVFLQSPSEAFGIVFIEALASGLPIVCCDDPIRRELLGDNAFYCTSDLQNIKENIKKAVAGGVKRKSRSADYDWDIIAKDYLKMIINL